MSSVTPTLDLESSRILSSLEKALASNRSLQSAILSELAQIARHKAKNRSNTERLRQQLPCNSTSLRRLSTSVTVTGDPARANPYEYRPWHQSFFTGPMEDRPKPNPDIQRRRNLEASTFLAHTSPPWSTEESKAVQKIMENHTSPPIDYQQIALKLASQRRKNQQNFRPRSAQECELFVRSLQQKRQQWTKAESMKLVELVHYGQSSWQDIAASLNNTRTAWECMVAYQTKLRPIKPLVWTQQEDKILVQYAAAAGPQCVLGSDILSHLSTTLLVDKTKQQISVRLNHSLCNPKLSNEPWSADEERKLVVCMKVYHKVSPNTAKVLNIAASHFPNRSGKSVSDKWKKSLDPGHSSLPFSAEEDERLLAIVKQHPSLGWSDLCERFFQDRHPERIAKRWADLAKDDDILVRSNSRGASGVVVSKGPRRKRIAADAMLTDDDFAVQVQKSKH